MGPRTQSEGACGGVPDGGGPDAAPPQTCVVAVHGGGRDRRAFLRHAPFFHRLGLPILLFDCRGQGNSDGIGRGIGYSLREAVDVMTVCSHVKRDRGFQRVRPPARTHPGAQAQERARRWRGTGAAGCAPRRGFAVGLCRRLTRPRAHLSLPRAPFPPQYSGMRGQVVVVGTSQGAAAAIVAAGGLDTKQPPAIDAVVAENPFVDLEGLVLPLLDRVLGAAPRLLAPLKRAFARLVLRLLTISRSHHRRHVPYAMDAVAGMGQRPLLLIHGGRDRMVQPHHSRLLRARARGPVALYEHPDASHTAVWDADPERWEREVTALLLRVEPSIRVSR